MKFGKPYWANRVTYEPAFCKTRENANFSKKWQNGHSGKNPKFFLISNDETDFTVGIVS